MTEIQLARESLPEAPNRELYTRKRRAAIMEALEAKDGDPTGSFIPDAARHAGLSPKTLRAWLEHGEQYPNGPFGRLTKDVFKRIADANDQLRKDIYQTANGKKWEGLARIGEQLDPDTWARPKEGGTTINVNIVDKLALIHKDRGNSITSGD